jgi:hypothetical protein
MPVVLVVASSVKLVEKAPAVSVGASLLEMAGKAAVRNLLVSCVEEEA